MGTNRDDARRDGNAPLAHDQDTGEGLSRRELLKRAGIVVGAAVAPALIPAAPAQTLAPASAQEELRALTRIEYDTLDAICSRIIPTDENGPGAREARAARFIDWALHGALSSGNAREQYAAGLAAVEAHAMTSRGSSFAALSPEDQDSIVGALAQNAVPQTPQGFFNMVRTHAIQGTFSDPFYGGNANFAGWDLIGYPGARIAVPAEYQQWGTEVRPNHRSAYDSDMFSKGVI